MTVRERLPLLLVTTIAFAIGGCGSSSTKTVSVSGELPTTAGTQHTSTTGAKPSPTPTTPSTSTATSTTSGTDGTGGAEATRTATAPAFTRETAGNEGLSAALAVVRAHGYTAGETSTYRPEQALRVLVGTRSGSSDGYGQQAFFFVDGRYLGTDTREPSASVKVVGQDDTEVTLAYPLYRPGDPLSKPSGGETTVRFQLNNGRLVALGQIPSASQRNGG